MQGERECIDVSLIIFLKSFSVTIEQQHKSYFTRFYVQNNISQLKVILNIRIRCFERFK